MSNDPSSFFGGLQDVMRETADNDRGQWGRRVRRRLAQMGAIPSDDVRAIRPMIETEPYTRFKAHNIQTDVDIGDWAAEFISAFGGLGGSVLAGRAGIPSGIPGAAVWESGAVRMQPGRVLLNGYGLFEICSAAVTSSADVVLATSANLKTRYEDAFLYLDTGDGAITGFHSLEIDSNSYTLGESGASSVLPASIVDINLATDVNRFFPIGDVSSSFSMTVKPTKFSSNFTARVYFLARASGTSPLAQARRKSPLLAAILGG